MICLDCGRGYELDPPHLDCQCPGVAREEFEWVAGFKRFTAGQPTCTNTHDGPTCTTCGAAV